MNFLQSTNLSVRALVAERPILLAHPKQRVIFATVSPNPMTRHACIKKVNGKVLNLKMPYGMMTQRLQYDYIIKYIRSCYLPFLDGNVSLVGTWELNKQGNVHFHMLIQADNIQSDIQLQIFRRDVYNCVMTIDNMNVIKKKHTVPIDYMNNIVYMTDSIEQRLDYMDKDYDKTFNNIYFTSSTGVQGGSAASGE